MSIPCLSCMEPLPQEAVSVCPCCKFQLPARYLEVCAEKPPLWVVMVGFSNHGKTTLLNGMMLTLENLGRKLPGVYHSFLDQKTHEGLRQIRLEASGGTLPEASDREDRLLLSVHRFPDYGDRFLSIHDVRGELFNRLDQASQALPMLRAAQTIWMVVSLHDLHHFPEGNTLPGLLDSLHNALLSLGCAPTREAPRSLVVIFTKAECWDFGNEALDYLQSDPFLGLSDPRQPIGFDPSFSFAQYMTELQQMSGRLQDVLRTFPGGAPFLNKAQDMHYQVQCCVCTALGESPQVDNRVARQQDPRRVLDPLILTLARHRPPPPLKVHKPRVVLALDATADPGPLYARKLHQDVRQDLEGRGEPVTYYLGQARPVAHAGQKPPEGPARTPRVRLVGPILEQLRNGDRMIVFSHGPVSDLMDFAPTWRDRLLLVRLDPNPEDRWPLLFCYRDGDTATAIVDALFQS
jgi:hypothetical protein